MKVASLTTEQAFKALKTGPEGLRASDVEKRRKEYGVNALPSKQKKGSISILLDQFKSPLVYILLLAAGISLFLHELSDVAIIAMVLVINALLGYYQESKAENTLYQLRQILPQQALVKRDGDIKNVDASELVPGDIVLLKAGEKVVADIKVTSSVDVSVNEAFLTGESRPVKKQALTDRRIKKGDDSISIVYAGSIILYGEGEGIVTSIGTATKLGTIAKLVHETGDTKTPLQKRIKQLADKLVVLLMLITVVIFLIGINSGYSYLEMIKISVALSVAAIPEGLLIAITVILAIGMQRILQRKALVKQLLATETLGSASIICTDKTGTLTEGSMKVTELVTNDQVIDLTKEYQTTADIQRMLDVALYCNDAVIENYQLPKEKWKILGRPTDRSLMQLVVDERINVHAKRKALPRISYIPFDSKIKMMATLNRVDKEASLLFVKGAPEKLLHRASFLLKDGKEKRMTDREQASLLKKGLTLSTNGNRILAAGYKKQRKPVETISLDDISGIVFVGFYVIEDPIRPEAKDTIALAKKAGIETVMITGDHPKTALAIARDLNLGTSAEIVMTGEMLEKMTDNEFKQQVKNIKVYARVAPEDKLRIVKAWQDAGHVVAMTGDGINDAPALKKADIGIAIGSGTEVAKEAADLVLIDDNFKTIVAAIAEGRVIFKNVKKVALILLSSSFAEIAVIAAALLLGVPLPLLAAQILWINVITDGFPQIALSAEPAEKNILDQKPVKRGAAILDFEGKTIIVLLSMLFAGGVLAGFFFKHSDPVYLTDARTMAFSILALSSLLVTFSIRDIAHPIWHRSVYDNPFLFWAVVFGIALQLIAVYVPVFQTVLNTSSLQMLDWGVVIGITLAILGITELLKWFLPKIIVGGAYASR